MPVQEFTNVDWMGQLDNVRVFTVGDYCFDLSTLEIEVIPIGLPNPMVVWQLFEEVRLNVNENQICHLSNLFVVEDGTMIHDKPVRAKLSEIFEICNLPIKLFGSKVELELRSMIGKSFRVKSLWIDTQSHDIRDDVKKPMALEYTGVAHCNFPFRDGSDGHIRFDIARWKGPASQVKVDLWEYNCYTGGVLARKKKTDKLQKIKMSLLDSDANAHVTTIYMIDEGPMRLQQNADSYYLVPHQKSSSGLIFDGHGSPLIQTEFRTSEKDGTLSMRVTYPQRITVDYSVSPTTISLD